MVCRVGNENYESGCVWKGKRQEREVNVLGGGWRVQGRGRAEEKQWHCRIKGAKSFKGAAHSVTEWMEMLTLNKDYRICPQGNLN